MTFEPQICMVSVVNLWKYVASLVVVLFKDILHFFEQINMTDALTYLHMESFFLVWYPNEFLNGTKTSVRRPMIQEYTNGRRSIDHVTWIPQPKFSLVHQSLMAHPTFDFADGLKVTSIAMRCVGLGCQRPRMELWNVRWNSILQSNIGIIWSVIRCLVLLM